MLQVDDAPCSVLWRARVVVLKRSKTYMLDAQDKKKEIFSRHLDLMEPPCKARSFAWLQFETGADWQPSQLYRHHVGSTWMAGTDFYHLGSK